MHFGVKYIIMINKTEENRKVFSGKWEFASILKV